MDLLANLQRYPRLFFSPTLAFEHHRPRQHPRRGDPRHARCRRCAVALCPAPTALHPEPAQAPGARREHGLNTGCTNLEYRCGMNPEQNSMESTVQRLLETQEFEDRCFSCHCALVSGLTIPIRFESTAIEDTTNSRSTAGRQIPGRDMIEKRLKTPLTL